MNHRRGTHTSVPRWFVRASCTCIVLVAALLARVAWVWGFQPYDAIYLWLDVVL